MRLPPGNRQGAVMLEVLRGGFVSDPKPVLVLDSTAAVADIERLDVAKFEGALLLGPGNAPCALDWLVAKLMVAALQGWPCTTGSTCTAFRTCQGIESVGGS